MGQADSVLRPAEIAARIKHFREVKGLAMGKPFRPAHLAEALGVSRGAVSEWEAGHAEPTHENLARIAHACGVSLAEFWAAPIVVVNKTARRRRRPNSGRRAG